MEGICDIRPSHYIIAPDPRRPASRFCGDFCWLAGTWGGPGADPGEVGSAPPTREAADTQLGVAPAPTATGDTSVGRQHRHDRVTAGVVYLFTHAYFKRISGCHKIIVVARRHSNTHSKNNVRGVRQGRLKIASFLSDMSARRLPNLVSVTVDPDGPVRPKIQDRPAFCGARALGPGLLLGSAEVITVHCVLPAGLRAVLERR